MMRNTKEMRNNKYLKFQPFEKLLSNFIDAKQ